MGQIIRLADIIARLSEFDEEDTIYAREPWSAASDAMVAREPEEDDGELPPEVTEAGLTYFLEIDLAMEFIEAWIASLNYEPSASAICERIIQYAVNDA
jgi:hypothetical protein